MTGDGSQNSKVGNDDYRDKYPEKQNEFALRDEVGLAGFIDQF